MKKLISFIAALVFIMLPLASFAAEPKLTYVQPPEIAGCETAEKKDDTVYSVKLNTSSSSAEALRLTIYEGLTEQGFTHDAIVSSEAYLIYNTLDICQIKTPDTEKWITVKTFEAEADFTPDAPDIKEMLYRISYINDILPALNRAYPGFEKYCNGFSFEMRFMTVSANWTPDFKGEVVVATDGGNSIKLKGRAFGGIDYVLSGNAVNAPGNPEFFIPPLEEDILLDYPSKKGWIFDGWAQKDGTRIKYIRAGSTGMTEITACWLPMTYSIDYVLSTRTDFDFGKAPNADNPTSYKTGDGTKISDIKAPIGGFSFGGWYLDAGFSGRPIESIPEDMTGDVILYAKWVSFEERETEIRRQKEEYIKNYGYGDIDNDGIITAGDARIILRASVRLETVQPALLKRADFSGKNRVTAADARTALRVSVGLDSLYDILTKNGVV